MRKLKKKHIASVLDLHASSLVHRRALGSLSQPDVHLGRAARIDDVIASPATGVWKGRVPQLQDWIAAWAECCESVSFRKQSRVYEKQTGACNSRKTRRNQLSIMAEVARRRVRKRLREASCIALAVDGKGPRKIWRYRCDAFDCDVRAKGRCTKASDPNPFAADGILGVLECHIESLESAQEDYGVRGVDQFVTFLKQFCTPLKGEFDQALYDKIVGAVRMLSSDGAASERKQLFYIVRQVCPNVTMIARDIAHAVRIAAHKPLHNDHVFGVVWDELFGKKHALVPDIQHSDKYKDLLQAAQERVLAIPGALRPMDVVLKHLSFAKQRFDSFAEPAAKLALMLLPVAVLLSHIASDERCEKARRDRAVHVLKLFKPEFCMAMGLSADFGLLVNGFIRIFDCGNHDIANSQRELDHFRDTMHAVFKQGWIVGSRAENAGVTARELHGRFITDMVARQIKRRAVFRANERHLLIWGECPPEILRDLVSRTQLIVDSMLHRIDADFDADILRRAFQCFDCRKIRSGATGCAPSLRKLAVASNEDPDMAVREYRDVFRVVLGEFERLEKTISDQTSGNNCVDNRLAWSICLCDDFVETHLPTRAAPLTVLPRLIRFYFSVLDGECAVERDLGYLQAEVEAHCNMSIAGLSDIVTVHYEGPKTRSDWANGDRATEYAEECALLWREVFGARLGIYAKLPPGPKKMHKDRRRVWASEGSGRSGTEEAVEK